MRYLALAGIALCLAVSGCKAKSTDSFPELIFYTPQTGFPPELKVAPYNATGTEPSQNDFTMTMRNALRTELLAYDRNVLENVFRKVVYVKNFALNGNPVSAALIGDTIYISVHERDFNMVLNEEIARGFLNDHPGAFDEDQWAKLNKEGFTYPAKDSTWRTAAEVSFDPRPLSQGFISERAMNSFADDVIVTAGALLSSTKMSDIRANPTLLKKAQLLIEFYKKIDSTIDTNSFTGGLTKRLYLPGEAPIDLQKK